MISKEEAYQMSTWQDQATLPAPAPSAEEIFRREVLAILAEPLNELTVQVHELENKVQRLEEQLNTPAPTPQTRYLRPKYSYIRSVNNPFDNEQ